MTPILDLAASHVDDLELRQLFSELCPLGSVSSTDRRPGTQDGALNAFWGVADPGRSVNADGMTMGKRS